MSATVVFPDAIDSEIRAAVQHPEETAGVLLVSVVEVADSVRLLARELHWVADKSYVHRTHNSLRISSDGYVPALARAETIGAAAIWLHTHPGNGSQPIPSSHDLVVDRELSEVFRVRTGSAFYGALIFSPVDEDLSFTGHIARRSSEPTEISRLWRVGDRLRLTRPFGATRSGLSPTFDRQVRAFGAATQQTLGDLSIAIVGCGGTGSAVAEQLARLGVRNFFLVDPDTLSASNLTRVYGSGIADVDKAKVHVLAAHLRTINPDILVESIRSMVTVEHVARRLTCCDVVFGCTDDNAGRLVLSRLSSYFLIPVLDCGVLLTSDDDGALRGIDGRVTILAPGQACLVCRGRIDLARASSELLTPEERLRRVDEGYAPALGRVEPAVVTFTTAVAAAAVGELLERLIGFGPEPRPSEVMLRYHEREISTNIALPNPRHYCDLAAGKLGVGPTNPFLDLTWHA